MLVEQTRRRFLRTIGIVSMSVLLASCTPNTPEPFPTPSLRIPKKPEDNTNSAVDRNRIIQPTLAVPTATLKAPETVNVSIGIKNAEASGGKAHLAKYEGAAYQYGTIINVTNEEFDIDAKILRALCEDPRMGIKIPKNHLVIITIIPESFKNSQNRDKERIAEQFGHDYLTSVMDSHFRTLEGGIFSGSTLIISLPDEVESTKRLLQSQSDPIILPDALNQKLMLTFVDMMRSIRDTSEPVGMVDISKMDISLRREIQASGGIKITNLKY